MDIRTENDLSLVEQGHVEQPLPAQELSPADEDTSAKGEKPETANMEEEKEGTKENGDSEKTETANIEEEKIQKITRTSFKQIR